MVTAPVRVLYPMALDVWTDSISSKFRELVLHCDDPAIHFYASGKPSAHAGAENASPVQALWARSNLTRIGLLDLLSRRYDIVHNARGSRNGVLIVTLLRRLHPRTIKHVFSVSIEPTPERWNFRQLRFLVQRADVIIANSHAVAAAVEQHCGRTTDLIIPNGVDTDFFAPDAADLNRPAHYGIHSPYVLFVGTLEARKRPDLFVELARRMPHIRFVMIGKHPAASPVQKGNLPDNVQMLGLVPKHHVRDLLAGCHALIFPSELEGLPNAVLEALAMGVPVLAQAKSSLPELIRHGENGWLLDVTRLDSWVDHIQGIVDWSDSHREQFRARVRNAIIHTHSWDTYAQKHAALYHRLCP